MFVGAAAHFCCEIILLRHQFCRNYKTGNTDKTFLRYTMFKSASISRRSISTVIHGSLFRSMFFLYMFNLILRYFCKINSTRLFFQLLSESFGLTTGLVPPRPSVLNDDAETPFLTR